MDQQLDKYYENGVILREQNISQKSCWSLELLVDFLGSLDLFKEVLQVSIA